MPRLLVFSVMEVWRGVKLICREYVCYELSLLGVQSYRCDAQKEQQDRHE